ncbi:MAG: hypothetical protein L0191_11920, partial [Acidobacteria bacterium]|nr:hypothetical protein [Acidobacteriota bacterium]
AGLGYYHWRVTGHPLRLPYQVHEATYATAPAFLWEPLRPEPAYRHEALRAFHGSKALKYQRQRSLLGLVREKGKQFGVMWGFYLGPLLTLSLVMLPWTLRDRWMRVALVTCSVVVAGLAASSWMNPHYAAPIAGLLFALVLQSMRHLRVWRWRGRPTGRVLVWGIVALCVVFALPPRVKPRADARAASLDRARILARLEGEGGRHLVIVRRRPSRWPKWEWVYNAADIDGATVVWAREMDAGRNRQLLEYFRGRRAWLLEADEEPPTLTSFHEGSAAPIGGQPGASPHSEGSSAGVDE